MGDRRTSTGIVALRKIATNPNGNGKAAYGFTVPANIAEHLQRAEGALFRCELVDEGVLFRLVDEAPPEELPSWLTEPDHA